MQVQFPIIRFNYYTAKSNMGRSPCCSGEHSGLKRGPWTHEEDQKLKTFLLHNPNTSWRLVPPGAGLLRCGKSCRLRWMNYLRPDIRRGNFTAEEETKIIRLHAAVGNKWSVIASQLPGRTDNEIKNLWNTKLRKQLVLKGINPITHQPLCNPLLSDYVKQWVKSIENVIIAGIMTQPSLSPTDNHLNNNASISSSSADVALPSEISSLPVDSQIPECPTLSQPPPPFNAWSSHFTNSLFTSSFVDDHSLNKEDNSASNYLLEEGSSLFAGFSEYFKYEVEDNTSHALLDTEMSSVASAGELEEGLRYWE